MTIKDMAMLAGVSIGTVDRVVHNRGGVNKKTEERVKKILEDNNFQVNAYARSLKLGKSCVIGVLLPLNTSEFGYWNIVLTGIKKAGDELNTFGVNLQIKEFDRDKNGDFLSCFHSLEAVGVDAILLPPFLPSEVASIKETEIPIAYLDSSSDLLNPICVIAQNPYKGGYTAGHMASLLSHKKGTYICIQTHSDAFNSYERARGFSSYISSDSANHVININVKNLSTLNAALDSVFASNDDVCGIFTVNSITSLVGNYLINKRLKEKVVLVGYDLVSENRAALQDGRVDCVISQRPFFQGYTAINQIYRYIMLSEKQVSQEIPIDIYFKDNLIERIE